MEAEYLVKLYIAHVFSDCWAFQCSDRVFVDIERHILMAKT